MNGSRPLVSICLKSYNQREYLSPALEGVFAQTYRPLEIVISDDHSTDGSWELIGAYVGGDRVRALREEGVAVIANRNETNLGNVGNWERCCELAHGELLVKADGDDISLPERTEVIVKAWEADGRRALAVCHSGWQIGPAGESYGRLRRVTASWPLGAAMAYSPRLYREFPSVPAAERRRMDDELYTRRALMLGSVLELPDRLVRYRLGVGATSALRDIRSQVLFCNRDSLATIALSLSDLEHVKGAIGESAYAEKLKWLKWNRDFLEAKIDQLTGATFAKRLAATRRIGFAHRVLSIAFYLELAFLMPRLLGDAMLRTYVVLRNFYWRHS